MTDKPSPRLLEQVRGRIRLEHYSIYTEQAYLDRIKRFILFHGKPRPKDMGSQDVEAFFTHFAAHRYLTCSGV